MYVRRQRLQNGKDFTCHCPRCDAPGDDTRQFPCCDSQCTGSHLVCHPLSREHPVQLQDHYTGVEYVEPYLLPCTVCQRTPSPEYQAQMLAWEATLPELFQHWEDELNQVNALNDRNAFIDFARRVREEISFPPRHMEASRLLLICREVYQPLDSSETFQRSIDYGIQYIYLYDVILPGARVPKKTAYDRLSLNLEIAYQLTGSGLLPHNLPHARQAQGFLQEALRMIMHGREARKSDYDTRLAALMKQLTLSADQLHTAGDSKCAFCEESPVRAALTLSLCSCCRVVSYCSVGCQKAHWPVHKPQCKKA